MQNSWIKKKYSEEVSNQLIFLHILLSLDHGCISTNFLITKQLWKKFSSIFERHKSSRVQDDIFFSLELWWVLKIGKKENLQVSIINICSNMILTLVILSTCLTIIYRQFTGLFVVTIKVVFFSYCPSCSYSYPSSFLYSSG